VFLLLKGSRGKPPPKIRPRVRIVSTYTLRKHYCFFSADNRRGEEILNERGGGNTSWHLEHLSHPSAVECDSSGEPGQSCSDVRDDVIVVVILVVVVIVVVVVSAANVAVLVLQ